MHPFGRSMADLGQLWKDLAGLAKAAVRSFLRTVLAMTALGVALAAASHYLLAPRHPVYGFIVAAVALIECGVVGVALAGKRALASAAVHGLRVRRLGESCVALVFGRMLDAARGPAPSVARAAERLPLAEAETLLTRVVADLVKAQPAGGGPWGWARR